MTETYTYTLDRNDAPDIRFSGVKLAHAGNLDGTIYGTSYNLYRTVGGKYVCQKYARSEWANYPHGSEVVVVNTPAQVAEFFGHGEQARRLYDDAGLDIVEEVD